MADTKSTKKSSAKTGVKTGVKTTAKSTPAKPATGVAAAKTKAAAATRAPAKAVDAPKAPAKPRAKKPATATVKAVVVPAEQRRHYIEMAAYYIAERRSFAPGNPLEDWVQAEAEIDRLLAEGRLGG